MRDEAWSSVLQKRLKVQLCCSEPDEVGRMPHRFFLGQVKCACPVGGAGPEGRLEQAEENLSPAWLKAASGERVVCVALLRL